MAPDPQKKKMAQGLVACPAYPCQHPRLRWVDSLGRRRGVGELAISRVAGNQGGARRGRPCCVLGWPARPKSTTNKRGWTRKPHLLRRLLQPTSTGSRNDGAPRHQTQFAQNCCRGSALASQRQWTIRRWAASRCIICRCRSRRWQLGEPLWVTSINGMAACGGQRGKGAAALPPV